MLNDEELEEVLSLFDGKRHELQIFMETVRRFVGDHPELNKANNPIIHSYKSRMKDRSHLEEKIRRKEHSGRIISRDNLFQEITDLSGVRILHLFQQDFASIDKIVRSKIVDGDWVLGERAKAYSWDPETVAFFGNFDLNVEQKDSFYTSVHYLIKPRADSPLCCELQVRTLFEEIWGEVDHRLNYPVPSDILACKEQLKVLSKIVGGGSRLLDSIQRLSKQT